MVEAGSRRDCEEGNGHNISTAGFSQDFLRGGGRGMNLA